MTLPLCAYCGHPIIDQETVFLCPFPDIPGIPKVAWHWNLDKEHKDRLCCFSFDGHDGNARTVKVEDGDLAALVTIMDRGKGRVLAGKEFGAYLKGKGITIKKHDPPAKGQLALI